MCSTWRLSLAALALLGLLTAGRAADKAEPNTLTDTEKSAGWKLLFDGKTTEGWHAYRGKGMPDKWKVIEGTLVFNPADGKQGGDIVTDDQYENFELSLEWKVAKGTNSGVMYRVAETKGAPYETGPEYQILDNAGHPDGRNPKTSAASCYALYAPTKDVTKPVGQWNRARIVVKGNHVEHWLNGVKVVEYEFGSADWKKRVADSKFASMDRYGKEKKGHIDLQDHGGQVAYRSIKIKVLKAAK